MSFLEKLTCLARANEKWNVGFNMNEAYFNQEKKNEECYDP